jgi:hypothetical protein
MGHERDDVLAARKGEFGRCAIRNDEGDPHASTQRLVGEPLEAAPLRRDLDGRFKCRIVIGETRTTPTDVRRDDDIVAPGIRLVETGDGIAVGIDVALVLDLRVTRAPERTIVQVVNIVVAAGRGVAVDPPSAKLGAIEVARTAAIAFALGGALTACGGALLSTFYTFNASMGVVFTMKALIIVIMGGVGDVRGAVIAAMVLGIAEIAVATLIDPGLTIAATYALFILVLLFRPQGIFGRQQS